jgi:hypothetical protein
MALKNRDGTVYQLRGPNPLMQNQDEWDKTKIKLFNMGYKSEVIVDASNPIREFEENVVDIGKELKLTTNKTKIIPAKQFIKEIAETSPAKEPLKPFEIQLDPQPVVLNVDHRMARLLKERGAEFFCAPCIGQKTHTDTLYGSSYKTSIYGDKFIFDAIEIDRSDLQIQFWCTKELAKHSVVLRKDKEGGERWWCVDELEPKSGGFLVLGNVSELNPDFS